MREIWTRRESNNRQITPVIPVLLLLAFSAILWQCGSQEDGLGHVVMVDNAFSPPVVQIPEGGTVRFANKGNSPHNALGLDKSWSTETSYGSLSMIPGSKADVLFPEKGVYPYYCTFHATPDGKSGMIGTVVVGDVEYSPNQSKPEGWKPVSEWSGVTRKVPQQYPTIQNAVDASKPGDMILVDEGIYKEEVVVTTPSLVIRGTNRNKVIIDGEFKRGNGIIVVQADGVTIENITSRNNTLNGFYWTGVKGYRGSYLTAYNNGDYGVYAFDAVDGVLEHSYASGSPDSGFYIGQCYPCNAVIDHVISEKNALGYSGTNSGGDLYILNSIWKDNFGGIGPNTLDTELLPPERETTVMGNLVMNNNNLDAPSIGLEYTTFGNGILVPGGLRNRIEKNLVIGNSNHGILVIPNLDDHIWLSHDNEIRNNIVLNSGKADLVLSGPMSLGNCFEDNIYNTALPAALETLQGCSGLRFPIGGDLTTVFSEIALMLQAKDGIFPHGDWKTQAPPGPQPEMPAVKKAVIKPALFAFEDYKLDLSKVDFPKETESILRDTKLSGDKVVDSFQPMEPDLFWGAMLLILGVFLPFALYTTWTATAVIDLAERNEGPKVGWAILILVLPMIGSAIYHARVSNTPKYMKWTLFGGGLGVFFLFLVYLAVNLV